MRTTVMGKSQMASDSTKGYLITIVGTVLWSMTAIFIRYLNNAFEMPPILLAFWRDGLVAVTIGLVFLLRNRSLFRLPARNKRFILVYGLILASFNALWTVSVKLNGAAVSTVLAYSSVAFTALVGRWLFDERLRVVKIVAIVLSLSGCMLVSDAYMPSAWSLNPLGILVGLLSGVGFAGYTLMGRASAKRGINSWTALLYTFALGSVILLGLDLLTSGASIPAIPARLWYLGDSRVGWGALILLVIGPTIGGYGLYTLSMHYLPASTANLIATMEPSLTAIQAYLLIGERFSKWQVVGGLMILTGVVIIRYEARKDSSSY